VRVVKAVVHHSFGGPEVLELAELPEPKTHVDSVLVRVKAAAVNPADLGMRAGALAGAIDTYFPVVPGWDIAGIVERAGLGAPEFTPGDEVIGYLRGDVQHRHGAYAEKAAADVRTLVRKPRTLSWAEAAALPLAGLTAYQAVVHALRIAQGETLLVHGAAGGVGSLAVQIARSRGAHVLGTASLDDHDYLRTLGVEPVTSFTGRADAVLDTVGRGALAGTAAGVRTASIAEFTRPGVVPVFARLDHADLLALADLADAGELKVRVARTFRLEDAELAHRAVAAGHTKGKVVLAIS
jgi:NADPH:quinone reductase-like Zn-dependent oxidoreductase